MKVNKEQLEAVAAALEAITLDGSENVWVTIWTAPARLAAIEGVRRTSTCYVKKDHAPYTIETAEVTIGRVQFKAQARERASTPEEIAEVDRESDLHEREEFRSTRCNEVSGG